MYVAIVTMIQLLCTIWVPTLLLLDAAADQINISQSMDWSILDRTGGLTFFVLKITNWYLT